MNVSLKKAAALSRALLAAVPSVFYTRNLSPFDDIPPADDLTKIMGEQITLTAKVIRAGYDLRGLISKANEGKINELLCKRAACDAVIQKFKDVPQQSLSSVASIERALEAARAAPAGGSFSRQPGVEYKLDTTPIVDIVSSAKKEKTAIEDELSGLNFSTKIELPADVEETLKALNLI